MRHSMPLLAVAVLVLSIAPAQADLGDQLAKLLAEDGEEDDRFGISVAISGAIAIVGATWDDDNGAESGSAYFFVALACPADLNGDVDAADLALLLGNWGPC